MKQKLVLLLLILINQFTLYAQQNEHFESELLRNGYTAFAKIKKEKPLLSNDKNKTDLIKQTIKFDNSISFTKISTKNIGKGLIQEKYQLYKNGIKIRGGEYLLHSKDSVIAFIHGFFASFDNENLSITDSKDNKKKYAEIAINEFNKLPGIKDTSDKASGVIEQVELIYYFDYSKQKYTRAYQVQITSKNSRYSENIFISATNDNFLGAENLICTINFQGTAQTQYNGPRNIVADAPSVAGPFRLQETRNNVLVRTRNMNNRTDLSNVTEFTDNDNNWTAAEHGNNRAAFDAHWGAETVYDYWLSVHNRNSIDGNGMGVESFVHWDVDGDPDDFNASWFQNSMRYGDGFGATNPLTALDICAHEIGHGIDQFTGNLAYERESGALDEGFADIWGASIEAWATPNKQRWLIGEDVWGGPLRNMANPNANGQPDTYLGNFWVNTAGCTPVWTNDFCGVHTNSGVLNFWFFLVSDGGTGTNDLGNNYNVTGLGINTAARIAYLTKQLMNNSLADYPLTRAMSVQAAQQLFGVNSCEEISVTNAWFAVGVGAAYSGTQDVYRIVGDDFICSSKQYNVSNLPANATVTWTANTSVTISPTVTMGTQPTTVTNAGYSHVTYLTATIAPGATPLCAAIANNTLDKFIKIGLPTAFTQTPYWTQNGNTTYMEECNKMTEIEGNFYIASGYVNDAVGTTYSWSKVDESPNSHITWGATGNSFNCMVKTIYPNDWITLRCTVTNACGSGFRDYTLGPNSVCAGRYSGSMTNNEAAISISPNPASGQFNLSLKSKDKNSFIKEVIITNKMGAIFYKRFFSDNLTTRSINLSANPSDVYVIKVYDGKLWLSGKLVLKK